MPFKVDARPKTKVFYAANSTPLNLKITNGIYKFNYLFRLYSGGVIKLVISQ